MWEYGKGKECMLVNYALTAFFYFLYHVSYFTQCKTMQTLTNNNVDQFWNDQIIKSIYIFCACLSVDMFVSKKRQNGWTDRVQIFVCDLIWPQGRFMDDRIFKNLPLTKFDFGKICKSIKFVCLFLFYNVFKEKMFTIEIEDGCEAP